ncbi:MAG: DUF3343 domain-containing protein [Peptococcaceae bacterium]|jgi:hypothetical protein|nr:DUF3343 domain-containing protein [Peptococcaceae bacterium]
MDIVFTFRSTRDAIGGEKSLLDNRLPVSIMPLPSQLGAGCGLCLRVAEADLSAARRLLAAARVAPEGVYSRRQVEDEVIYAPLPPTAPTNSIKT